MQQVHKGYDSIQKLEELLLGARKPFLVSGQKSFYDCGARDAIVPYLKDYVHFNNFSVNPKLQDARTGIDLIRKEECDLVIAVGGGSALDMAKGIALLSQQDHDPEVYVRGQRVPEVNALPLLAIPTTAGTGGESTPFAVMYIGKTKYSLAHPSMLPQHAILDGKLTEKLPAYITACTGMDALCQSIEAFWSVKATPESQELSRKAIRLVLPNLMKAVLDPTKEARQAMLEGANYSGRAIAIAKTTAAHSVSYPLTSHFNVPHGEAVALTLPYFIVYNAAVTDENVQKGITASRAKANMQELFSLLSVSTPEEAKDLIIGLRSEIGLRGKLSDINLKEEHLQIIVDNGFNPQRVINNPRELTRKELLDLLRIIL